jgi:hypothetical protein
VRLSVLEMKTSPSRTCFGRLTDDIIIGKNTRGVVILVPLCRCFRVACFP